MVAHMSLDSVEEIMEGTGALYAHSPLSTNLVEVIADAHVCRYLKGVDRYNEWIVSAFIPTGGESFTQHTLGRLPWLKRGMESNSFCCMISRMMMVSGYSSLISGKLTSR